MTAASALLLGIMLQIQILIIAMIQMPLKLHKYIKLLINESNADLIRIACSTTYVSWGHDRLQGHFSVHETRPLVFVQEVKSSDRGLFIILNSF